MFSALISMTLGAVKHMNVIQYRFIYVRYFYFLVSGIGNALPRMQTNWFD